MGGLVSTADYVAAALALTAGVHTALGAGGKTSTMRARLAIALSAIAVSLSLSAPATLKILARSLEIESATRLAGTVFAMTGAWCALAMVAHAVSPWAVAVRRIRLAGTVLAVCVAIMVLLVLAARAPVTVEQVPANAINVAAVVYEGLHVGYMCWGMVVVLWLICRCARHGAHRIIRLSMRLYVVAGGAGLTWVGWQIATVITITVAQRSPIDQGVISDILASVAVGLIVSGAAVLPSERWIVIARAWHDYHALGPLWRRVTAAVPEVLLHGGSIAGGVEYALYRRVIEIRDAQRILRRYRDPTVPDGLAKAVEGFKPAHADLIVESTELVTALAGHRAGRRHQTDTPSMWVPQRRPIGSLRAEGRWLVRVARVVETDINRVPERGALARDIAWSIAGSYIVRSSKRSIGRRVLLGPSCSARWVVRWLASKWSPEQ